MFKKALFDMCVREGFCTNADSEQYSLIGKYFQDICAKFANGVLHDVETHLRSIAYAVFILSDFDQISSEYVLHCVYKVFSDNVYRRDFH